SGNRADLAFAYTAAASALHASGYASVAVHHARTAVAIFFDELHDELNGVQALGTLANILATLNELEEAEPTFRRAIELCERFSFKQTGATLWNNLGVLQDRHGRVEEALHSFESARDVAAAAGYSALQANAESMIALALYDLGDPERAYGHACAGVEISERLRASSERQEQRALRRHAAERAEAAALTAAATGRNEEAWNFSERAHARMLAEELGGGPATFARTREILRQMPQRVALVSYVIVHHIVVATVARSDRDSAFVVSTPMNEGALAAAVEATCARLMDEATVSDVPELSVLSQVLIDPVSDAIDGADVLLIVPAGVLWNVPFAMLSDRGELLSNRCTLAFLPNAAVLHPDAVTIDPQALTVVGDPLGDLEGAKEEAAEVADQLGVSPLLGNDATRERVRESLAAGGGIHFAGHASFVDEQPELSGLRVANGRVSLVELASWNARLPLCVLTACDSGRVGEIGGGEVVGLSTALLQLGARSVIAAQWSVYDVVGRRFTRMLYEALLAGRSVGDAVAHAVAEISEQSGYGRAPFILIGDWRTAFR
ncbi:MAG: CHAT domain-containing protein, partial [Thermoanaerobaculia bacterium]